MGEEDIAHELLTWRLGCGPPSTGLGVSRCAACLLHRPSLSSYSCPFEDGD